MNNSIGNLDLIHFITELQDVSAFEQISVLKENSQVISTSEVISIENGLNDLKKGRIKPHFQVKKRYEKWL